MGKYIYGKINEDTYFHPLRNEFHIICFCYGVYLEYKNSEKKFKFSEYFSSKKHLFSKNWHFVNVAHNHIIRNSKDIGKRELRKLGYTGFGSTPMCPVKADIIQNEIFKFLEIEEFAEEYYKFLIESWNNSSSLLKYNVPNKQNESVDNVFHNFIGFQRRVLLQNKRQDAHKLYYNLKNNEQYKRIYNKIKE